MRPLTTHDGLPLHWRQWTKPGIAPALGTVLIVHGLGEHIGRYEQVAARLNQWGWHVVGYDQRGHGASGGARGDVPDELSLMHDLALVIDQTRGDEVLGRGPLVMLGHSMGGMVAARFAAGGLLGTAAGSLPDWFRPLDALVLSSPALDPGMSALQKLLLAAALPLLPHLAAGNGLKPSWISRDAAVVQAYVQDPLVHKHITPTLARSILDGGELVRDQAEAWTLPTLVLWAGSDRCVSPEGSADFVAAAPPAVVQGHVFPALYHEIFNEPEKEQVFERLQAWLESKF